MTRNKNKTADPASEGPPGTRTRAPEDHLTPARGYMDMANHPAFTAPSHYAGTALTQPTPPTIYRPRKGVVGAVPSHDTQTRTHTTLTRPTTTNTYDPTSAERGASDAQATLNDYRSVRQFANHPVHGELVPGGDGTLSLTEQYNLATAHVDETITERYAVIDPADPVEDVRPPAHHAVNPQNGGVERCGHCGSQLLGPRAWDPETLEQDDACGADVDDCDCCACPECDATSIYHRATMDPAYRCINCEHEFETPVNPDFDPDGRAANPPRKCLSCARTAW